jgi:hypothetical protein
MEECGSTVSINADPKQRSTRNNSKRERERERGERKNLKIQG